MTNVLDITTIAVVTLQNADNLYHCQKYFCYFYCNKIMLHFFCFDFFSNSRASYLLSNKNHPAHSQTN